MKTAIITLDETDNPKYIRIDCSEVSPGGSIESNLKVYDPDENTDEYNAAIDGMESTILAMACAGFNVESPAFKEAILTTLDAIENNFG